MTRATGQADRPIIAAIAARNDFRSTVDCSWRSTRSWQATTSAVRVSCSARCSTACEPCPAWKQRRSRPVCRSPDSATAVAPLMLLASSLLASYFPALRATKADPIVALRSD
jgi:hypothetical protein